MTDQCSSRSRLAMMILLGEPRRCTNGQLTAAALKSRVEP